MVADKGMQLVAEKGMQLVEGMQLVGGMAVDFHLQYKINKFAASVH